MILQCKVADKAFVNWRRPVLGRKPLRCSFSFAPERIAPPCLPNATACAKSGKRDLSVFREEGNAGVSLGPYFLL